MDSIRVRIKIQFLNKKRWAKVYLGVLDLREKQNQLTFSAYI